jgi:hypothetical protein
MYSGRERLGVVRVSTAYEFYEAVKKHLNFIEQSYLARSKPPFEATSYMLFYFAADARDAHGKHCDLVLDRSQMWDCKPINHTNISYEFLGLPMSRIQLRNLPCPCENCFNEMYEICTNRCIVKAFKVVPLKQIVAGEYLQLPLESNKAYTKAVLKAFLTQYNIRVPGTLNRHDLINRVLTHLVEYLLPAEDS